jgi:Kef-type K+ transport system membrane component KefB
MMTIRQTGAKGDFVETLLQVVALDNIVGLMAYSVAISIAVSSSTGQAFSLSRIFIPILTNGLVLFLGAVFGVGLSILVKPRSNDNRLIISVALLFAFCGICTIFEVSPLLGCMSMGTMYINLTNDDKLFKQLNYFSPPFLLMFFVRSGMSFDLKSLVNTSGSIGSSPLLLIGILYFIIRILGKYAGAFLGCLIVKKKKETRNYLGLALIPQAGVAIGLAALGPRTLKGETGNALETIILASSVLYELIGPASAKLSLYLSKSYSTKLEDLVDVNEKTEEGVEKTPVELLIDRIQKIQEELPSHTTNEAEDAFTEAAEQNNADFWSEMQKINMRSDFRRRKK